MLIIALKLNNKQTIKITRTGEQIRFRNYEGKIKSPFVIYADFESILEPEDNGNQSEFYTHKYKERVA